MEGASRARRADERIASCHPADGDGRPNRITAAEQAFRRGLGDDVGRTNETTERHVMQGLGYRHDARGTIDDVMRSRHGIG